MTYQQAYDKIIQAYFKDEIRPYSGQFCFCGTIAGFNSDLTHSNTFRGWYINYYGIEELQRMEYALLETIFIRVKGSGGIYDPFTEDNDERRMTLNHPKYEDALFEGMCAALEVLKEIHRSRGESVDSPELTKRVLVKS